MNFRKIVSLSIMLSFMVLSITGLYSFFDDYSRIRATLHTFFGGLFIVGILFHINNNFVSLRKYIADKPKIVSNEFKLAGIAVSLLFTAAYLQLPPLNFIMNWGTQLKADSKKTIQRDLYEVYDMNPNEEIALTLDLLRSEHYWHPQIAIWVEDTTGSFLKTLFITKATAKGLFFGGRTKDNFKVFDEQKDATLGDFRRVDALPVWSHKRGIQYSDGMYVPPSSEPLPDGITGATPIDNFIFNTSLNKNFSKFRLKLEINVAFDDNEYYSDFDFPDDEVFHNGTGQLGQPSLIFESVIDRNDEKKYYLMEFCGHGHHSGQNGETYREKETLTTALKIVERIVVGIEN